MCRLWFEIDSPIYVQRAHTMFSLSHSLSLIVSLGRRRLDRRIPSCRFIEESSSNYYYCAPWLPLSVYVHTYTCRHCLDNDWCLRSTNDGLFQLRRVESQILPTFGLDWCVCDTFPLYSLYNMCVCMYCHNSSAHLWQQRNHVFNSASCRPILSIIFLSLSSIWEYMFICVGVIRLHVSPLWHFHI